MIYTKNKLITVNSKYGIQENGTMKSKMLFNYKNLLSDDENILKSFVTVINAQIPCSFYVINALNNKLVIAGPTITTTTIYVSYGNYNANTLITELVNQLSLSGLTMSITINTSLTMILVLLIMFVFGGESIRGFIFAMLIGIIVGTYSSLFIATPVLVDTISDAEHKRIEEEHNS